tara:strand:- start:20543 stop:20662 length:120 start_codon:yes stop_codon:yes gene_type:complete
MANMLVLLYIELSAIDNEDGLFDRAELVMIARSIKAPGG